MGLGSFATELRVQSVTPRAQFLEVNLVGREGLCRIVGLVIPPPGR